MDLVVGAKRVIIAMEHVTKDGQSKIKKKCSLPLTASHQVNLIVTDMAVIEVNTDGLLLKEIARGLSIEDVVNATEAVLQIPEKVGIMLS